MFRQISKPAVGEFAPYTSMYIDLLRDDGKVLAHMQANLQKTIDLIRSFPEEKLSKPHAAGEWTIKEIIVHIIDDERIYAYRALRFARGDSTELPGFEQDDYVPTSLANERGTQGIIEELKAVRAATITLFNSFTDGALLLKGVGSGNVLSVRAAAYHIAGHELHHLNSIEENYGMWQNS